MNDRRRHTYPPPPDVEPVDPAPDRSLHVIGMALAAISGALVGFIIRGWL